ncbi:MAG: M20/M25/M40 family metallo-hydrolase [Pseudomonadota bacterium]
MIDQLDSLARQLTAAGASVHILPSEKSRFGNLVAHFGQERAGGLLWAGHLDVVPAAQKDGWTGDPFKLRHIDDQLVGRGTTDMKGFLACLLATAETFSKHSKSRPISIAITHEEETSMAGAYALPDQLRTLGIAPDLLLVGEPTGLVPCIAHPGITDLETVFIGHAGHAADSVNTVSAIDAACAFVVDLPRHMPPQTHLNIGTIDGGSARNVVAAKCSLSWELRYGADVCAKTVIASLPRSNDIRREDTVVTQLPAFAAREHVVAFAKGSRVFANQKPITLPFVTEAGIYAASGLPALVIGPGDWHRAHQVNEHITQSELLDCLDLMALAARDGI